MSVAMQGVRETLDTATTRLARAGCDSPRLDAELLLAHVLATSRVELLADGRRRLAPDELDAFDALVGRRERREPLAYVLGEWGFRRLTLEVDDRVLVPRPETEVVVERCLALLHGAAEPRVLDVGAGSGAIALAIADEHPGALVTAIDESEDALALARANAVRAGVAVDFERRDLFDGLPPGPWHLVVSNPPYVGDDELERLEPEVAEWEPAAAVVDAGQTRALVDGARGVLRSGGALVLETHGERAREVAALLGAAGYGDVAVTRDLAGLERVVEGRWKA